MAYTLTPAKALARIEAWADHHEDALRRCPPDQEEYHRNLRDNDRAVTEALRPVVFVDANGNTVGSYHTED